MKLLHFIGLILLMLTFGLALSACSAAQASNPQASPPLPIATAAQEGIASTTSGALQSKTDASQPTAGWPDGQAAQDAQGAIEVVILPLNLNNPGETLDFEVSLNTHSVDLSMDLAALATLTTDRGVTVQASLWQAPSSGHHVSGTLTFPASLDGQKLLDNARQLTLTLVDLDAPQRVFVWTK